MAVCVFFANFEAKICFCIFSYVLRVYLVETEWVPLRLSVLAARVSKKDMKSYIR